MATIILEQYPKYDYLGNFVKTAADYFLKPFEKIGPLLFKYLATLVQCDIQFSRHRYLNFTRDIWRKKKMKKHWLSHKHQHQMSLCSGTLNVYEHILSYKLPPKIRSKQHVRSCDYSNDKATYFSRFLVFQQF